MIDDEICSQIATKRSSRFYNKKRSEARNDTTSATLSMKLKKESFSNKDSHTNNSQIKPTDLLHTPPTDRTALKGVFFDDRTPLEYSRDHPVRRLIIAQYLLQTMQTDSLKSVPFVIRFNTTDQQLELGKIKRKVRDALKSALGEVPHYWLHFEYANKGRYGLHCNMEILINLAQLKKVRNALKQLYGRNTKGVDYAVRCPFGKRQSVSKRHGDFYAVYNWTGYSSKEDIRIRFKRDFMKDPQISKGKHYSISQQLNSMAKALHSELIKEN